jgi:hypothetical protein
VKQIDGELMQRNHNVPFRNSNASKVCVAVLFAIAAKAAAKRQLYDL